jgi:hypothetical protein
MKVIPETFMCTKFDTSLVWHLFCLYLRILYITASFITYCLRFWPRYSFSGNWFMPRNLHYKRGRLKRLERCLFLLWYSYKIAELALKNNRSLKLLRTVFIFPRQCTYIVFILQCLIVKKKTTGKLSKKSRNKHRSKRFRLTLLGMLDFCFVSAVICPSLLIGVTSALSVPKDFIYNSFFHHIHIA